MKKDFWLVLLLCSLLTFVITVSCDKSEDETCKEGTKNCACDPDGNCEDDLECVNDKCVAAGDGDTDTDTDGDSDGDSDTDTDSDTICTSDFPLREPITTEIFTADPSAHVFDERLYIYPSHDQDSAEGSFYMIDYHVFSLNGDCEFVDRGEILHVDDVAWAEDSMWAPDAAYKDGTYYFYFPAKDDSHIFHIGVATSDTPTGPFTAEDEPIPNSYSIDPAVFIDDDGTAYMYFGGLWGGQMECYKTGSYVASNCNVWGIEEVSGTAMGPRVARLDSTMKAFDGEIEEISIVDENGDPLQATDEARRFFEGAWVHKYDGTYYLSYSTGSQHTIVYATGDSPTGPFTYQGLLLPNHDAGWTTHHSVVEYGGNWYLFYHDAAYSGIGERRCTKAADMHYNNDGSIQTVSLH